MSNRRNYLRTPYQMECILSDRFGDIKSQTVNVSILGLRVLINETTPFKIGDRLSAYITSMQYHSLAEVRWTEKDFNKNTTRIGLKLSTSLV